MGRVTRTAIVAWALVCFAGCASIAGLDGITEQDCAPNCGSNDSSVPVDSSMMETGPGDSTQPETAMGNDTGMTMDSSSSSSGGGDTGVVDTGTIVDSGMDTFVWDGPPFDDAPYDSGCGDLNTVSNCGACGNVCAPATMHQTASNCCSAGTCPGSTDGTFDTCVYTCANGFLDCNASTPPDTDGCECAAPATAACCGGACPVAHTTGLVGQAYYPPNPNFYDCDTMMNIQLAQDACIAYVTARGGTGTNCGEFGPIDGGPPDSVCAIVAGGCGSSCMGFKGDCICWTVSGTYAGQVIDPVALGLDAQCYTGASSLTFH